MALPSGYTPLEYIESTGTQYVDTKFTPNQDTRVKMECEFGISTSGTIFLFGSRETSSSRLFQFCSTSSSGGYRTDYNENNSATISTIEYPGRFYVDKNKNVTDLNGDYFYSHAYSEFSCVGSLYLFGTNSNGSFYNGASAKIYFCLVFDNGTLIRDYIPVQRQDGAVGLLDKVNNVFYPDAAGGNFIAGPVAVQPEAPESLEVIGTTQNAVVLAWPAVPVDQSYRMYRDGVVVYEGTDLHYTDSGLASGSVHAYSIHGVGGTVETDGVTAEATTTDGIVLITDRTAGDVSAGRRKGRYNALDLIRVGEAMVYVQGLLNNSGYAVSVSVKLDWRLDDIPTQEQMTTYLANLRTLRSAMDTLATTPAVPDSMTQLNHERANDIEQILVDVEYTVYHVFSGLFRSGQSDAWAGGRRPFPTANSDMGRNWEELDAMNTSWANWQVATWYLLLYGNLKEEGAVS